MRPWAWKSAILAIAGLGLIVIGTTFSFFWPSIFQQALYKELSLSPNSKSYDIWKDTGNIPIYMEFYFFNWTNPQEFKEPGKKPNFIEVGPYTFLERREKVNVTFHPENNTVTYLIRRSWYFDPDRSKGSLNDKISQLNTVAVSAAHKIRYWPYFYQTSLSAVLKQLSDIHIVKTVDELLFSGYEDHIIEMRKLVQIEEDIPPFDRFGWFYMRNGSVDFDGIFNMATGEDDISTLGVTRNWNFKDTTKFYKSPCNIVEGSAGDFFPPNRQKDEVTLFSPDLCRPLTFEYSRTVDHQGISGYRYSVGEKSLSNETWRKYPHEQAKYFEATTTTEDFFATDGMTKSPLDYDKDPDSVNMGHCYCNGQCAPMGLMNVSACRFGAPAFVSLPHFYKADPMLRNQVIGLNPNADDHDCYLTIEPTTGIPVDVAARLQINILIQPSITIELFQDVPRMFFPVFWFNLRSGTTEDISSSLRQLLSLPDVGSYGGVILAVVGSLMLVAAAVLLYAQRNQHFRSIKSRIIGASNGKKTELVYMDTSNRNGDNDDVHARPDRQLHPKL